jgi:hypothetical protein
MMIDVSPDELREAIESQHGGKATFVQAVPVREQFQGQTAWDGVVHVFHLEGHPDAERAYAWSTLLDEKTGRRRFYAVLHAGPVKSPADAVRAAIVAEARRGADG